MKLMEYLDTARGFGNMLDQLASPAPDPQLLRDLELAGHPALQAFAARSWAERRGSAAGPGSTGGLPDGAAPPTHPSRL